ncbi:MAG: AAA family ATPase [Pseudomonadota bacterium]
MECQACHTANPESNRFCEYCGVPLTYKCAECGFDCNVTSRFCGGCGISLRRAEPRAIAPRAAGTGSARSQTPGVTTRRAELKQATVLFADIVSSTEHIAQLDPEAAMERLQPAILTMCDAVERFGGTVIRTTGDGVMALFGVPRALEGHATLACEAALQMQAAFGAQDGILIRVGLHSGPVASDPHAADSARGGGAHGLTIHLGSRVVAEAPPGEIALTADTRALVRRGALVKSLGFPSLKGIPQAIEIFVLASLGSHSRHRPFDEGKLSPLQGRDPEMTALQAAQEQARRGEGNVIGVTGAPGAGKSRLCFEFARWCTARAVPVFEVHAQLYGHATPLQPALELLRVFFFRIPTDADASTARPIVTRRLGAAGLDSEADVMLVHEFLGLSSSVTASQHGPRARRARLLAIVRKLFEDMSGSHAILVIEDLHWLDEASEEFVSVLIHAVSGTRLLLVLNYRNSYSSPWLSLPNYKQLALGELSASDTTALVRELVSSSSGFTGLHELIARRSGGNPFFAEELVQSLAESVALGEAADTGDAASIGAALPSTVQAVIGARIDRLPEAEKSVLQTCAIIGKEIPLGVLEQVTTLAPEDLQGVLDGLYHAQLLQPADGARQFAFRHPLIQEVAYTAQLKTRRSAIHAAVAGAMVGHYAERIDEFAALIAYHFAAAGACTCAATYESKAAQWLCAVDSGQAIKHWHRVRSLLDGAGMSNETDRLKVMANSKICWLGWREGLTFTEVKPFIDEAVVLAGRLDPEWTQLLLMVEGRILQAGGASADLYVDRMERAIATLDRDKNPGRAVTLHAALSQAYGWAGMLQEALAANDAALERIAHIDTFDLEFLGFSLEQWVLALRARLFTRLGRFGDAGACLGRLLKMTGASIDPVIAQMPHFGYVELAAHTGDIHLARQHLAIATDIAQRNQAPYLRVFSLYGQALVHAMQSEFDEAARVLGETLALVRNSKVAMEFETEILASLAENHRSARSTDLALALSKEAARLSSERGNRLPECRALMTWASILDGQPQLGAVGEADTLRANIQALLRTTGWRGHSGAHSSDLQERDISAGSFAPAA